MTNSMKRTPEQWAELKEIGDMITARYGQNPKTDKKPQPSKHTARLQHQAERAGIKLKGTE